MNNTTKAGASLVGGGAIVGGSIAVDKYLLNNDSLDEEGSVSILPAAETTHVTEEENTVRQVLEKANLVFASTDSDYSKIVSDLKSRGVHNWASGEAIKYGLNKPDNPKDYVKNKCQSQLNRRYSEFKGRLKEPEFKAIKLFCANNYSLTENAKDYLEKGEYIESEGQTLDANKWSQKIQTYKSKKGTDKTEEDLKKECLELGKNLYRVYKQENNYGFYDFCVLR